MKKSIVFFALIVALISSSAFAQNDTLRVATYNLLNFDEFSDNRLPYFRTIVRSMNTDILIVQEIISQTAQIEFLNQVMNFENNEYLSARFRDGRDTDNSLFYRKSKVSLDASQQIRTSLRDISEYTLQAQGVEFRLYSLHLKAGFSEGDQIQRRFEADTLRNYLNTLPANSLFIVGGDFNISGSSESAFLRLTEIQADNDGRLFDPINAVGEWNNNPLWNNNGLYIHTQSTRSDTVINDGSTGGLDDRFDMLLISNSIWQKQGMFIAANSYTAFGNDGRHFNLSINSGLNRLVPDSVADALFLASDHLPVYADFVIDLTNSVKTIAENSPSKLYLSQNYPNPFNAETQIPYSVANTSQISLIIYNISGQKIRTLIDELSSAGQFQVEWNGKNDFGNDVTSGLYFYKLSASGISSVRKLILLK